MIYSIYILIRNILIITTIYSIILAIQNQLGIINNNNTVFMNVVYVLGGILLSWELFNRIMFPKVEVNVTIENEKFEK